MCCYTEKEAKAADVLKSILKAGLFLGIMFAVMTLAGCSSLQNLADKRSSQGCYVSGAKMEGMVAIDVVRTSIWCSDNLPESFAFSYDDGRTKVSIGESK